MTPNHRLTYTLGVDCFLRADLLADGADITGAEARLDEDPAVVRLDGRAAEAQADAARVTLLVIDYPGVGAPLPQHDAVAPHDDDGDLQPVQGVADGCPKVFQVEG